MKTELAVLETGIRWASNMLVELGNNYGHSLNPVARGYLIDATRNLVDCMNAIRFPPKAG